jgi:hypothetical protein
MPISYPDSVPVKGLHGQAVEPPCVVTLNTISTRDPVLDYRDWYGHGPIFTLFDSDLERKFWHRRDVHRWLEANLADVVLIQRYAGNAWNLSFPDKDDYARFCVWFDNQKLEHTFTLDITEGIFNEIKAWMAEQITGKNRIVRSYSGQSELRTHISIQDLAAATLFKLRWHGVSAAKA